MCDRRVVGWSAGRHVDHPFGWETSPWPAREVTDFLLQLISRPGSRVFIASWSDLPLDSTLIFYRSAGRGRFDFHTGNNENREMKT